MSQADLSPTDPPTIEFLSWVARRPRTYRETMDAWRTGCPRFPIWKDAHSAGLVRVVPPDDIGAKVMVVITPAGRALIRPGDSVS